MFDGIFGYVMGGLVIGLLARLFKPGADPMGWIMTILLGILGAVAGGWASANFGLGRAMTWVAAVVAATFTSIARVAISGTAATLAVPEVTMCGPFGNSFACTESALNPTNAARAIILNFTVVPPCFIIYPETQGACRQA